MLGDEPGGQQGHTKAYKSALGLGLGGNLPLTNCCGQTLGTWVMNQPCSHYRFGLGLGLGLLGLPLVIVRGNNLF